MQVRLTFRSMKRGMMLVYLTIGLTATLGLLSFGLDYGRVQLAKSELQRATDAAARYSCTGASDGTYSSKAIAAAAENTVDGIPLVLQAGDISAITWNTTTKTYTIGGASPNGVRIIGKRAAARGTAVPLTFGALIGIRSCDIKATSVAYYGGTMPPFGFVGITSLFAQNNAIKFDSYDRSAGAYGGSNILQNGYLASNGGMTMTGGVIVSKDIYMQSGQALTANGAPNYGTRQTLTSALSYPSISSVPSGATNLGNINGSTTIGSGSTNTDYIVSSMNIGSGATLTINGPVTIYLNGNCTIGGTVTVTGTNADNFKIRAMSGAGVNIQTATIYCDIYAPNSPVNLNSVTNFYGRIIGSQLSINGPSGGTNLHYDESLDPLPGPVQAPAGSGTANGTVTLVD